MLRKLIFLGVKDFQLSGSLTVCQDTLRIRLNPKRVLRLARDRFTLELHQAPAEAYSRKELRLFDPLRLFLSLVYVREQALVFLAVAGLSCEPTCIV